MQKGIKPATRFLFTFALFGVLYKGFTKIIKKIDKNISDKEKEPIE